MTFTEIRTAVMDRLNLSSSAAQTRVGNTINDRYRRVTTSIGLHLSRRAGPISGTVTIGVQTLTFNGLEKVISVRNSSGIELIEVTTDEIRALGTAGTSDSVSKWAPYRVGASTVTILMDVLPQTAITLYADGYEEVATLSGSNEPAFPESFHDILIHGAVADEARKLQKLDVAKDAEFQYAERLGELRLFNAASKGRDLYQNKLKTRVSPHVGSGAGGDVTSGLVSYTQSGLITFDRDPSAPFAVTSGSAKVDNLDADLLDGKDWNSNLTFTGSNLFSGAVEFDAAANFDGAVDLDSTLDVAGVTTLRANLLFSADDAHDIGATGATRPRDFHLSRNALIGGTLGVTGIITGRVHKTISNTEVGAQNNWAPTGLIHGINVIYWSGASAIAVTGFEGGQDGDVIIFRNVGSVNASFAYNSGSSDADNRLSHLVISAATSVAPRGHITYIYNSTLSLWIAIEHDQGTWITPTFDDAHFLGDAVDADWALASGDVTTMKYHLAGNALTVAFYLGTTSVANAPDQLIITNGQWGSFTATSTMLNSSFCLNNGTAAATYTQVVVGGTTITNNLQAGGTFANSTNGTALFGTITFEVS